MNKVKYKIMVFIIILVCNLNLSSCCFPRKKRDLEIEQTSEYLIKQLFIGIQNDSLTEVFFILASHPEIINSIYTDIVILQNSETISNVTPLTYAIMRQNFDMVTALITFKVDVNLGDGNNNNPLSLARSKDNRRIVTILLSSGAKIVEA